MEKARSVMEVFVANITERRRRRGVFKDAVGQVNLETRLEEEKRSMPDELLAAEAV